MGVLPLRCPVPVTGTVPVGVIITSVCRYLVAKINTIRIVAFNYFKIIKDLFIFPAVIPYLIISKVKISPSAPSRQDDLSYTQILPQGSQLQGLT